MSTRPFGDATLAHSMNKFAPRRLCQAGDAAGAGAPRPVLDAAALGRLRELDPDGSRGFVAQLLRTFDTSLTRHLGVIAVARDGGDLAGAGSVAHLLKSSSASIGALAFSQACHRVEQLARAGDAAALGEPLALMLDEAERARAAVRAILAG